MDEQYYRKPKPRFSVGSLLTKIGKNKKLMLSLLFAIPLAMFMLFSNRGIMKKMSLEHDKEEMQAKVHEAELEQQKLDAESKALDTDNRAIEKVAREKYGLVREGETVYKVRKDK